MQYMSFHLFGGHVFRYLTFDRQFIFGSKWWFWSRCCKAKTTNSNSTAKKSRTKPPPTDLFQQIFSPALIKFLLASTILLICLVVAVRLFKSYAAISKPIFFLSTPITSITSVGVPAPRRAISAQDEDLSQSLTFGGNGNGNVVRLKPVLMIVQSFVQRSSRNWCQIIFTLRWYDRFRQFMSSYDRNYAKRSVQFSSTIPRPCFFWHARIYSKRWAVIQFLCVVKSM